MLFIFQLICTASLVCSVWSALLAWYVPHIIRTASGAALFSWIGWQNVQQFQLNFDLSRLKLVEDSIAHFCTSNLGYTLGCLLSIGYILETVWFFIIVKIDLKKNEFGTLSYITMLLIFQFSGGSYMSSMRSTDFVDVSNQSFQLSVEEQPKINCPFQQEVGIFRFFLLVYWLCAVNTWVFCSQWMGQNR